MSPSTLHLYTSLTDSADLSKVLSQHQSLVPFDSVLARIYQRLHTLPSLSTQQVRNVIVEEAEEREAAHFLAVPDPTPPQELHRDLITGLRDTYKDSGLGSLGDFGEQVEDWETLPLSVVWADDDFCKGNQVRVASPGPSNSSDVSQVRSKSGLKPLAARVKDLVQAAGPTACYQTIAESLINEFELPNSTILRQKAIKNLKRRAYDAINVMTAVGILTKQGETLAISEQSEDFALKQAKTRVSAKKSYLRKVSTSYQLLSSLILRNEKHKIASELRVSLPFLVVATPDRSDATVRSDVDTS